MQQRHNQCQGNLLHLQSLGDGTLSIEEIGRLPIPLVWTLHGQWAFCGADHYTSPPLPGETARSDERFALGYSLPAVLPMKASPTSTGAPGFASAASGAALFTSCAQASG